MTVALTIHQPYASLIAHGVKEWETRPHPPAGWPGISDGTRRQPGCRVEPGALVLIHAAVKPPRLQRHVGPWLLDSTFDRLRMTKTIPASENGGLFASHHTIWLPLGAVVATARITDVVPIDVVPYPHGMDRWVWAPPGRLDYCQLVYHEDYGGVGEHPVDISDQLPYGEWTPGRWAWRLGDVRKLDEPVREYLKPCGIGNQCWGEDCCPSPLHGGVVPVRGRQGVWRPAPALVAACGVTP